MNSSLRKPSAENLFVWHAAVTVLLGAFLLFQVQPLLGKAILPWFGGSPAVWTTAMLFFQVFLVLGYAYADLLMRVRPAGRQRFIHLVVVVAALWSLPILPHQSWQPAAEDNEMVRILWLLTVSAGVPYFLLATTGPLAQAWFGRTCPGRSPYRLYALSNFGALLALLSYPLLIEPLFTVSVQGWIWTASFVVFAGFNAGLAWRSDRAIMPAFNEPTASLRETIADDHPQMPWGARLAGWLLLPMLAVVLLLAVTNRLCLDVAATPFMWLAPLTVYLLTFMICFERERWYHRGALALAALLATGLILVVYQAAEWGASVASPASGGDLVLKPLSAIQRVRMELNAYLGMFAPERLVAALRHVLLESVTYLLWLFLACMLCHGELFRLRPRENGGLTVYYLCIAVGGAAGGVLVAVVAPAIFSTYREWNLGVAAVAVMAGILLWRQWRAPGDAVWRWPRRLALAGIAGSVGLVVIGQWHADRMLPPEQVVVQTRNFYGVLTVLEHDREHPDRRVLALYHGRILHGLQPMAPELRRLPTTYYTPNGGAGIAMTRLRHLKRGGALRVGVVGLGAGTLAAYGEAGDYFRFYEIDRDIIALHPEPFTYLADTPATVEVVAGDGRILLERDSPQGFDLLFLDAFSGDAVPVHLLAREAFAIYLRHLAPDGVIACNISNRHVNLLPVTMAMAEDFGLGLVHLPGRRVPGEPFAAPSTWVLLTANGELLNDALVLAHARDLPAGAKPILWTDQFSNLLRVMKW